MTSLHIQSITLRPKTGSSSKSNAQDYFHRARVYVWPEGESVLQNMQNRRERPYTVYKAEVLPKVLQMLGIPADTKLSWSQKAGCTMCPCSPGFVDNNKVLPWDIHITVSDKFKRHVEISGTLSVY